ncbi:unnamed protein product [Mytilus edulis]|uniref:Uncharacterized protein n=1 Tax=Mytilus edulis TaxID=6550 RepID=A0A8S3VBF6_MYTED|nr:unnamed protein product [Mytilus edulis]
MLILPTINSFRGSPFVTAPHDVSRASGTCASFVSSSGIGEKNCPSNLDPLVPDRLELPITSKSADAPRNVNDKYNFTDIDCFECEYESQYELDNFLTQIHYFEEISHNFMSFTGVKGRESKDGESDSTESYDLNEDVGEKSKDFIDDGRMKMAKDYNDNEEQQEDNRESEDGESDSTESYDLNEEVGDESKDFIDDEDKDFIDDEEASSENENEDFSDDEDSDYSETDTDD